MKKFSLLAALVTILASATFVLAGPRGGGERGDPGWAIDGTILSKLNLTEEQTEKVRALRGSFQKDITPLRIQIFEKKAELRLLWMQTESDAATIKAKGKEIHDLMWQIREKATDFRLALRSVLTSEQLSKFLALGGDWRHNHRKDWRHYHAPDHCPKHGPGKRPDLDQ
jgi:Spy/CpxP family protein refolding chaperone